MPYGTKYPESTAAQSVVDELSRHLGLARTDPVSWRRAWSAGVAFGMSFRLHPDEIPMRLMSEHLRRARVLGAVVASGPEEALASVDEDLIRELGADAVAEMSGLLTGYALLAPDEDVRPVADVPVGNAL